MKVGQGQRTDAAVVSSGVNKQSVKSLGEDIRFISASPSGLRKEPRLLVDTPVIYIVPIVILLCTAGAWVYLVRSAALRRDVAGSRNRKAAVTARP